jgi:NAD+ kinase
MQIVIMPNTYKQNAVETGHIIADKLLKRGIKSSIFLWNNEMDYTTEDYDAIFYKSDIVICIGGDGTFLHTSRIACQYDIPVLGVNMGKLGYLTEVNCDQIDLAVDSIKEGNYRVDERMMLDFQFEHNGVLYNDFALNDVVISRAESSMLDLELSINGHHIYDYRGDGIIVSSPTGSTAYSLSAGGPIVEPTNEVIIVTPICPHSLIAKPIVASPSSEIRIRTKKAGTHMGVLSADGLPGIILNQDSEIIIKRSEKATNVIRIMNKGFFTVLRDKINK